MQLEFSIQFGYNDLDCGVEREGPGVYSNEVVIQHHDRIVTSSDLGLSVTCQYDLANKTVANLVDLKLTGEITPSLYEESIVDSPNVIMRVADDQGQDTKTATVSYQVMGRLLAPKSKIRNNLKKKNFLFHLITILNIAGWRSSQFDLRNPGSGFPLRNLCP